MTRLSTTPPVARIITHQTPGPGPWVLQAACADLPTRYFFSDDPAATDLALAVCRPCPVRDDCAAYALAIPILDGVWGGLTEADRRRIIRRQRRHIQDGSRTAGQAEAPLPTGTAGEALRCRT